MEPERWERLARLHDAALQRDESQRAAFLQDACAGDEELRRELESLLAFEKTGESFMEIPALEAAALQLAAESKPLAAGTRLGPYEVVAPIGAGGMGQVYRAHDPRLNRDVAVKVLPPASAHDRENVARFAREARAASALNHPNIVSVFDMGVANDVYWIATELVAGEPLRILIDRGPLAPRKAVDIASQIASGLAAAHAAGIVHRDLKPGNIMLTRDGRVKILDFGLAKQRRTGVEHSATQDLTASGAIMGTAAYMSPEQVRGETLDQRSDIFSLGLILHELLSGRRTFTGDSSFQVMHAILTEDPPDLPDTVPAELARIVAHCLEKDPAARFQSAADIGFALKSVPGVERAGAASSTQRFYPKDKAPVTAPSPGRRLLSVVLLLMAAALATLAFLYFRRPAPSAQPAVTMSVLLPDNSRALSLAVSPNGREIAMVLVKDGRQQIWFAPSTPSNLPRSPAPMARWIPSGRPTAATSPSSRMPN